MGALNSMNIKKTINFFKRNGIRKTFYTVLERYTQKEAYAYVKPEKNALDEQREYRFEVKDKFSILVPTYETKETYLREMIDSVLNQTYSELELIIADASKSDCVETVIKTYTDKRIVYKRLAENQGISANTNEALKLAAGEYIGLLDHDDLLTEDALFEMAKAIEKGKKSGIEIKMLYSDEDKCDGEGKNFFEPHRKPHLNLDLLLSNNYICHFLVMKKELMTELMFDKEYDGAQDFDFVLRATSYVNKEAKQGKNVSVCHVNKVLYHWRCHEQSTASNPESKRYAYEAGKRALQDFCRENGIPALVEHSKHLGYYKLNMEANLWKVSEDIGAFCGKVINKNTVTGGPVVDGREILTGLKKAYSGYMNQGDFSLQVDEMVEEATCFHPKYAAFFGNLAKEGKEFSFSQKMDYIKSQGDVFVYLPDYAKQEASLHEDNDHHTKL